MGQTIILFLQTQPVINLFLILGAGLVVGKIRIGNIEIGSVTGVLFIGLIVGHLALPIPKASYNIGFLLFIYCIGFQAGPQFWGAFKHDGGRYLILALVTAGIGAVLTIALSRYLVLPQGFAPGMLAGALTSTPTLVAARDAVSQGLAISDGLSPQQVVDNLSAAYAITYVFGLAGLILLISFMPKIFRIDMEAEVKQLAEAGWLDGGRDTAEVMRVKDTPDVRFYRIENPEIIDRDVSEEEYTLNADIPSIKRDGEVFAPDYGAHLKMGDIVAVVATKHAHQKALELLGPEVFDQELYDRSTETMSIVVSNKAFVGRTLTEMNFTKKYHCALIRLSRGGVDLPRQPDLLLRRGDILVFAGAAPQLQVLAKQLGFEESRWQETDLVTFTFGIALGLMLGIPSITLGVTKIGLGSAGGVLLAGLILGMLHSRYVVFGRLPAAARHVLMELGMLLFMATVAVNAGNSIVETFQIAGIKLVLAGAAVTIIPVLVSFFIGRYPMRMNSALLLGAITGSMTSTAALRQINSLAQSSLPTLGYVGSYAFANVLLAVAGSVIMRL